MGRPCKLHALPELDDIFQKLRMFIEKPKKIGDCRQWRRLAALIPREGVMSPTGQPRCGGLAQTQLAADAANFPALPGAVAHDQFVARRRVTPSASSIELDLTAGIAAPSR